MRSFDPVFSAGWFVSRKSVVTLPTLLVCLTVLATPSLRAQDAGAMDLAKKASVAQQYGKLPLSFEPNAGQVVGGAQYLSRGEGYGLFLNPREAVLMLRRASDDAADAGGVHAHPLDTSRPGHSPLVLGGAAATGAGQGGELRAQAKPEWDELRMQLAGANAGATAEAEEQLPGTANYMIGNDAAKWHTNLPTFGRVRYGAVYPGVDLVYYGNQRQLEYDFIVAPGASTQPIQLHFAGSRRLRIDEGGNLVITAAHGEVSFHAPVLYQTIGGVRRPVSGGFALLANNTVGFRPGAYDHAAPLVIDPTLGYSTYLGGDKEDFAVSMALDAAGDVYLTGLTFSSDYPLTPGAFESVNKAESNSSESTAFVTKLNASGTALLYSTYVGGSGGIQNSQGQGDYSHGIAVDTAGNAYIAGLTFSPNFPVTSDAYQKTNKAYANSAQTGFVTKLNTNGTALVYSTYLGGSNNDIAYSIALDSSDNAYISGLAFSSDFPTTSGAYQRTNKSAEFGGWNEFVTKLNSTGSALDYSTFIGGSGESSSTFLNLYNIIRIAVDKSGDAYIGGYAQSSDFPVTGSAYQKTNKASGNGGSNITVSKLSSTGASLVYSTFIGGSGYPGDLSEGIALDGSDNAYVTGYTSSTDFPVTGSAFQKTNKGASSGDNTAFASKLNTTGSALDYSTYLGGDAGDAAFGVTTDSAGDMYVVGATQSADFPVTSTAYQAKLAGTANAFLTELNTTGSGETFSTFLGGKATDEAYSVAVGAGEHVFLTGYTSSSNFPVTKGAFDTTYKASDATIFVTDVDLGSAATAAPTTTVLKASLNPAVEGDEVTFTAEVARVSGTGTPTGNVVFSIDEKTVATVALSDGKAAYSTSTLATGAHYVLAGYAGSTTYGSSGGSVTETITAGVATPVFSPVAGTFSGPVKVTITDATTGATIYYTTTGSTPTSSSTKYTGAITLDKTTTLKAIAEKSGEANSGVATATYTITAAGVATPVFSPAAGSYATSVKVTITDATAGSTIYYTTTGSTPTSSSTKYTGAITLDKTTTLKAIAEKSGLANSGVATATYTITTASKEAATPVFTPVSGTYTSVQLVTIKDATAGATIYYTTSGATPTTSSTKYTTAIVVESTETIKAIAVASGYTNSAVATATYTIVEAPEALAYPATSITSTGATLNGIVDTGGIAGSSVFKYGTSSTALTTTSAKTTLDASKSEVHVTDKLTTLKAGTTYYFQVVVTTEAGVTAGEVLSFKTE